MILMTFNGIWISRIASSFQYSNPVFQVHPIQFFIYIVLHCVLFYLITIYLITDMNLLPQCVPVMWVTELNTQ